MEQVFVSFFCIDDYSSNGDYRHFYDLETVCQRGRHLFYLASVSIIGSLFWLLILPLVLITRLKQNEETYLNQTELISKDEDFKQRMFLKRYAFLYTGYKPEYFWWEPVQLLSQSLLILLVTVLANN